MQLKKQTKQLIIAAIILGTAYTPVFTSYVSAAEAPKAVKQETQVGKKLAYRQGQLLRTKYGLAKGAVVEDTLVWQGLPYAKAPVGELRWRAPQKPLAWQGIMDATKPGNMGIQGSLKKMQGSEDCLNLDIHRPNTAQTNLPIMVYVHGGNNQKGDSSIPIENFVKKADCVFVSINYRLGTLGFNNLPALHTGNKLEDSGNYAMLDIDEALNWVKANAAAFGGNAKNVTISGHSAGGRDVMAMLTSPLYKGKFQKAVSFCGGMTMSEVEPSQRIIANKLAVLAVQDNVKANKQEAYKWLLTSDKSVRDYLYKLPANRLAAAFGGASIRMAPFPHLYADGYVLPKEQFATKKYNSVPLIMLAGTNEFSLYTTGDPYFRKYVADKSLLTNKAMLDQFRFATKYGSRMYGYFNAEKSADDMFDNYHAPIYTCYVNYGNDPAVAGVEYATLFGATHGIWEPILTGKDYWVAAKYPQSFNNNGARALTDKMSAYFKNFLWTGNPNGAGLVPWDKWTSKTAGPTQLVFDADRDKAIITMTSTRTSYDSIIKALENDNSIPAAAKTKLISSVLNGRWFSKALDTYFHNKDLWQVKN